MKRDLLLMGMFQQQPGAQPTKISEFAQEIGFEASSDTLLREFAFEIGFDTSSKTYIREFAQEIGFETGGAPTVGEFALEVGFESGSGDVLVSEFAFEVGFEEPVPNAITEPPDIAGRWWFDGRFKEKTLAFLDSSLTVTLNDRSDAGSSGVNQWYDITRSYSGTQYSIDVGNTTEFLNFEIGNLPGPIRVTPFVPDSLRRTDRDTDSSILSTSEESIDPSGPVSVIVVVGKDNASDEIRIFDNAAGEDTYSPHFNSASEAVFKTASDTALNNRLRSDPLSNTTTRTILEGYHNPSKTPPSRMYKDGKLLDIGDISGPGTAVWDRLFVNSGTGYLFVYDIIVYETELTTQQIVDTRNYLSNKWDIPLDL